MRRGTRLGESFRVGERWRAALAAFVLTVVLVAGALLAPAGSAGAQGASPETSSPPCSDVKIGGTLPLPCTLPLADYEDVLYTWINNREYVALLDADDPAERWVRDLRVRDTGPFILGSYYGTHPAVRIYYSPEVYDWLRRGRPADEDLPPGSMIIKEMFNPPAARRNEPRWTEYQDDEEAWEELVAASITSWTLMIKDDQTRDGWFWGGPGVVSRYGKTAEAYAAAIAGTVDTNDYPFAFRDSDHGQASCLRCHSSAVAETTFVDLKNIEGEELRFRVDDSWRTDLPPEQRPGGGIDEATLLANAFHGNPGPSNVYNEDEILSQPLTAPSSEFTRYFKLQGPPPATGDVRAFPGQWADHVPAGPDGAQQFITSDNCIGCHGGLGGPPAGITMFLETGPGYGDGYNISPFGEWRWSPMGLAGRDPYFYSQLATELAILDGELAGEPETLAKAKNAVVNTCLSCHGAMGQRQLLIDHADGSTDLDPSFRTDFVYAHTPLTREQESQPDVAYHEYGNLAREGISCTVCHHIDPPPQWREGMSDDEKEEIFLTTSTTGQFPMSPPDELNGPFDDVLTLPMEHALGITPGQNAYIEDSRMCGTCHTINLPNVDCPLDGTPGDTARCKPFPVLDRTAALQAKHLADTYGVGYAEFLADNYPHSIEQATYLEWKNSSFADKKSADYQSCQDCHMPREFQSLDGSIDIPQLTSQIASIQDSNYPMAESSLSTPDLFVPFRDDYRRHELVGLNAFLVETFDQFDPILGLDETDYMTGAATGDQLAVENMLLQAARDTVEVGVEVRLAEGRKLVADVTVASAVGHRFPSGVGFRRAWIELSVLDGERGGEQVWISGGTNSVGLIVDAAGRPLPTEFFEGERFQPHYHGIPPESCEETWSTECSEIPPPITRQDQVQIYEEVTVNGEDEVTFSFIHRDEHLKDNRFLPRGWKPASTFPGEVLQEFMESTQPEGVEGDPDYTEGHTGRDTLRYEITLPEGVNASRAVVRARMLYQAFQPFWLHEKFTLSPNDPATRRLYYLTSHLKTDGTVLDGWKLPLVTCTQPVGGEGTGCLPVGPKTRQMADAAAP